MIREVPLFDVVTPVSSQVDETSEWSCRKWLRCQLRGCSSVFTNESELAEHYSVMHSSGLDLSIPPTVIVPTDNEPHSDVDSDENEGHQDVNRWPGIACPFDGCGVCIASYPGLVMHHRRVHGIPLPTKQRRAFAAVFRARRLDTDTIASTPAAAAAASSVLHSTSSAVVSGSFVCPVSGCGISCSSRDDLVAHVLLSHETANIMQPICKQEKDDSTCAPQ